MKTRTPTLEERKLWRESNRFTDVIKPEDEIEDGDLYAQDAPEQVADAPPPIISPRKRPTSLAPLRTLPPREAAKALRTYGPIQATLDLHGLTKLEAHARVRSFIEQQYQRGVRHLLIITGKGRDGGDGVLRRNLPHWLNEAPLRPLISALAYAKPEKGGSGVLHVIVKRA